MTKCITKQGDIYDPAGTLTGGSWIAGNTTRSCLLKVFFDLHEKEEELRSLKMELLKVENALEGQRNLRFQRQSMMNDMDLLQHSVNLLENQLQNDSSIKVCRFIPY